MPAAETLGGIAEARSLENRELWLPTVSRTFHGRDIFSPVAAHLATGTPFAEVGPILRRDELVELVLPGASLRDGGLDTAILFIDGFGNCRLAGETGDVTSLADSARRGLTFDLVLPDRHGRPAERFTIPWAATFGEVPVGAPLLFEDADFGGPALAVNQGSAADRFALVVDTPVRLEPA